LQTKLLEAAIKAKRFDLVKLLLVKGANVDSSILSDVIVETENE
jgi:hypothetical protein